MVLTRRDFLKASSALAAALTVRGRPVFATTQAGAQPVVWLQAQGCSGCSVSLLNTIHYMTADELLVGAIDLKYHPTVMAAAEDLAIGTAEQALADGGYVLVVEGAIPTGRYKECCYLWPEMTALDGVHLFAQNAAAILAVGACSSFGGVVAGMPNPTLARSLGACVGHDRVINIPGCPAHPDWIVGTVAHLLAGEVPALDPLGRPRVFFNNQVHEQCPNRNNQERCLKPVGCNGQKTRADCPVRQWNALELGGYGVNWCVGAGNPCQGCTEPGFPDGMSPFYNIEGKGKSKW
jgi:hydrogenase small subunit